MSTRRSAATSVPQLLHKQRQLRQQILQALPQTPWRKFLSWFRNSETILLARLFSALGFITAVLGTLDWSPLIGLDVSTGFNHKQIAWLGGIMLMQGIGVEAARRTRSDI